MSNKKFIFRLAHHIAKQEQEQFLSFQGLSSIPNLYQGCFDRALKQIYEAIEVNKKVNLFNIDGMLQSQITLEEWQISIGQLHAAYNQLIMSNHV